MKKSKNKKIPKSPLLIDPKPKGKLIDRLINDFGDMKEWRQNHCKDQKYCVIDYIIYTSCRTGKRYYSESTHTQSGYIEDMIKELKDYYKKNPDMKKKVEAVYKMAGCKMII